MAAEILPEEQDKIAKKKRKRKLILTTTISELRISKPPENRPSSSLNLWPEESTLRLKVLMRLLMSSIKTSEKL